MFNINLEQSRREFIVNVTVMFWIFISGLIFAFVYFIFSTIETAFLAVDCEIPQNVFFSTCQGWWNMALFPILNLKYIFIYANYFAIFGLVFGLFYMGFRTKKYPVLFVVHVISSVILGYLSIEIANIYRQLIQSEVLYNILVPFGIYNRIMLYFPQFMFTIIFLSGMIGFFGLFRSRGQYNEGNEDLG